MGYYEDDWTYEHGEYSTNPKKDLMNWCQEKIQKDTIEERLNVFLEWNGIIGYTGMIYSISQGELR